MIPVGLLSPVVTRVPGQHAPWEATASPCELAAVVEAADAAGLHHVTCSHHAVVPVDVATTRGGTYWDPLATLSYVAARTRSVRLVTNVLVLGYQHPLVVAKQYATLDRLSGGRVVLGVGVGSLQEEFAALAVPFAERGAAADDALRQLRRALAGDHPGVVLDPAPVQGEVPVWVGGSSLRSLRRAVTLGTGWMPFGLSREQLRALLDQVDRPEGFQVVLTASRPLDLLADPEASRYAVERLEAAGATTASVALTARSADHYVEQVHALAEALR